MKEFLHHLLFPRESNNHRAKVLHHDSLLVIICLFLFCTSVFAAVGNLSPKVLGISFNITSSDLLTYTNQKRQQNNLPPLQMNDKLTLAAQQKAEHMLSNNYWAHIAPDGTTPWYFIKAAGYEYLYAGENLARGFTTSSDVVEAWMNSPTHRENMLSANYKDIGFAIKEGSLTGSDTVLVVEELGSQYVPEGESAPPATPTPTQSAGSGQAGQAKTPTPAAGALVISPTLIPTVTPTPVPVVTSPPTQGVQSVQNKPLVDKKIISNQIVFLFLFFIIAVLVIDAIMVEKKKIIRVVAHNLDHVIFLIIIALVVIIIGRGIIL